MSKKPKKIKDHGESLIEVPILENGKENNFSVWYDPSYMGLYGEW